MHTVEHHLHLAPRAPPEPSAPRATPGRFDDLVVTAALFAVSFLPIASALAQVGEWSDAELGLATAGSLLAGRELWALATNAIRAASLPGRARRAPRGVG